LDGKANEPNPAERDETRSVVAIQLDHHIPRSGTGDDNHEFVSAERAVAIPLECFAASLLTMTV